MRASLGLTGLTGVRRSVGRVRRFGERMQGPFNEPPLGVVPCPSDGTPLGMGPWPSDGTPLGVGPCFCEACEACEACPLVGLALMRKRIRARVAFEPVRRNAEPL